MSAYQGVKKMKKALTHELLEQGYIKANSEQSARLNKINLQWRPNDPEYTFFYILFQSEKIQSAFGGFTEKHNRPMFRVYVP